MKQTNKEIHKEYCLEVWGKTACFTRPEFKVERVSYDVITPSAARNIFQSIFWKKYAMRWVITRIEVLNPIEWINFRRNEVGATVSKKTHEIFIEEKRQQRNTLMLRDVRYRIWARLQFIPVSERPQEAFAKHAPDTSENPVKYQEMFERRARQGQCFTQPYLGIRECVAFFRLVDSSTEELVPALSAANGGTRDLGYLLYDMDYSDPGNILPMFFRARMDNGVIQVPHPDSKEILR